MAKPKNRDDAPKAKDNRRPHGGGDYGYRDLRTKRPATVPHGTRASSRAGGRGARGPRQNSTPQPSSNGGNCPAQSRGRPPTCPHRMKSPRLPTPSAGRANHESQGNGLVSDRAQPDERGRRRQRPRDRDRRPSHECQCALSRHRSRRRVAKRATVAIRGRRCSITIRRLASANRRASRSTRTIQTRSTSGPVHVSAAPSPTRSASPPPASSSRPTVARAGWLLAPPIRPETRATRLASWGRPSTASSSIRPTALCYLGSTQGVFTSTDGGLNWTQATGLAGDVRSLALDLSTPATTSHPSRRRLQQRRLPVEQWRRGRSPRR